MGGKLCRPKYGLSKKQIIKKIDDLLTANQELRREELQALRQEQEELRRQELQDLRREQEELRRQELQEIRRQLEKYKELDELRREEVEIREELHEEQLQELRMEQQQELHRQQLQITFALQKGMGFVRDQEKQFRRMDNQLKELQFAVIELEKNKGLRREP